jgi:hypothetical protein
MTTKLIVYQLQDYDTDYATISEYIKKRPDYIKVMERVWIVRTQKTASSIRTALSQLISSPAKILVVDVTGSNWSSYGISTDRVAWMQESI